uniref:F-box domain-containing protein n=1 Tax=Mycena chlorophos TaxID=658473 RepID=A0ABQ0LZH9_MYCCL|nr:predicted protein [Mycena chlorophos]
MDYGSSLRCLPRDCWEDSIVQGYPNQYQTIRFTRELTDADWKSIEKLRAWIRELDPRVWSIAPHAQMLKSIKDSLGKLECLLPNLRVLHWRPSTAFVPWAELLVGPRLTTLALSMYPRSSTEAEEILTGVDVPFSRLRHLDLEVNDQRTNIPSPLSVSLFFAMNLSAIETLALPRVSARAWQHLASLPKLRELKLYAPQAGDLGTPSSPLPSTPPPFISLRKLLIIDTAITFALELLTSVPMWHLALLIIGSPEPAGREKLKPLYTAVASHCASDKLQELWLGPPYSDWEDEDSEDPPRTALADYILADDSLFPLFSFTNLVKITLRPPTGFTIDDTVIRDLVSAWSSVQILRLSSGSSVHSPQPATTLNALRLLAGHCPYLQVLMLPLNAVNVPDLSSYGDHRITQTALLELDVAISPIEDYLAVARFISDHFTSISWVKTAGDGRWNDPYYEPEHEEEHAEHYYHTCWKKVHGEVTPEA